MKISPVDICVCRYKYREHFEEKGSLERDIYKGYLRCPYPIHGIFKVFKLDNLKYLEQKFEELNDNNK